jgi:hypothetical protein
MKIGYATHFRHTYAPPASRYLPYRPPLSMLERHHLPVLWNVPTRIWLREYQPLAGVSCRGVSDSRSSQSNLGKTHQLKK